MSEFKRKRGSGAPRRIQTSDLLIRSQTLYSAELWARVIKRISFPKALNALGEVSGPVFFPWCNCIAVNRIGQDR